MPSNNTIQKYLSKRPLSWSAISSFQYDPSLWYKRYILNEKEKPTPELSFGKMIADSFQTKKPLAPVILYPIVEQKLEVMFSNIPLIGFMDTYDPLTHNFREVKTGKKAWDQKRADEHGQLKMYALMQYITHKIKPEEYTIHLDWLPTQDNGDFSISFVQPIKIHTFEVKLTMADILKFGASILQTVKEMDDYIISKQK